MHFVHVDGHKDTDSRVDCLNKFLKAYQLAPKDGRLEIEVDMAWFLCCVGLVDCPEDAIQAIAEGLVLINGIPVGTRTVPAALLEGSTISYAGRSITYGTIGEV